MVMTSGKMRPIADPTYRSIFRLELTPGATLDTGGSITIYDLPGVYSGA